jgi:RHH-type proline utilization regulon transcriptional repressor/proline dehydrogenase/delta 1-pyrroline-5-carboxylate dehydrogenase
MPKSFSPLFMQSEKTAIMRLLKQLEWSESQAQNTSTYATHLVQQMRTQKRTSGALESFLQEYTLDTEEGLALMTLAEALLRIPDAKTANALIHDKVAAANWLDNNGNSKDWIVRAAGVGLFMTSKTLDSVIRRVGEPFMRQAMISAMQILGKQFVLGQDIQGAIQNATSHNNKGYRMSYDILGEGARTAIDAEHYFQAYKDAIDYIGSRTDKKAAHQPGISVKLSALHPRYEYAQEGRCIPEITDSLKQLCIAAATHNIPLTVDAEENPRLNTSVQIIENIINDPAFKDWNGFGLAVQAYHKAAPALIDHMSTCAKSNNRRIQMRLVKGAYWDSEIKDAQVGGFDEFPVYSRKANTDLSYMACIAQMFKNADTLYPMIATHNAQSIAAALELNKTYKADFEFQRLFGMGEGLYDILMNSEQNTAKTVSIYAPVGPHKDLLPYLVRRLLENGANTSFVNQALNPDAPVEQLVADPVHKIKNRKEFKHPKINHAIDLFRTESPAGRTNSKGVDLNAPETIDALRHAINGLKKSYIAAPIINGEALKDTVATPIKNPANTKRTIGKAYPAKTKHIDHAFEAAKDAQAEWAGYDANIRADVLEKTANLLEDNGEELIALLMNCAKPLISAAITPDKAERFSMNQQSCLAQRARVIYCTCTPAAPLSASAHGTSRSPSLSAKSPPRLWPATVSSPNPPNKPPSSPCAPCNSCTKRASQPLRCNLYWAMAASAAHWSATLTQRASSSLAPPKPHRPSTAPSPPKTAPSCRSSPKQAAKTR